VTKKEIVKTISDEIGLTQLKTKEIVQRTFDAIVDTLVEETLAKIDQGQDDKTLGRIELRNFGVFEVKKRAARKARNPRTGDRVDVPEKFVVTFKPGKEMEERVRKLQDREQEQSAAPPPQPGVDSSAASPSQRVRELEERLAARNARQAAGGDGAETAGGPTSANSEIGSSEVSSSSGATPAAADPLGAQSPWQSNPGGGGLS